MPDAGGEDLDSHSIDRHRAASLGLVLGFAAPASASATYAYTGNNFTVALPPYSNSMSINGTLTLSSELAPDLSGVYINALVTGFSFSDGVKVIDLASAFYSDFGVSTDSSGNITRWDVVITGSADAIDLIQTTTFHPGAWLDQARINSVNEIGYNQNMPGTWTLVPEPGTGLS